MAKVAQSADDLEQHLREQVRFLCRSARAFDEGDPAEAKRLAGTLRMLLHHRPQSNSHALLALLGVRDQWQWLDSAGEIHSAGLIPSARLTWVTMEVSHGKAAGSYVPYLDDYPTGFPIPPELVPQLEAVGFQMPRPGGSRLPFQSWWSQAVIKDNDGNHFSRFDLIAALANTDGGAHVDPALKEAYHRLSRSNSLGWTLDDGTGERPYDSPVPASVRQIAYEVDFTIRAERPDLAEP